MTRTAKKGGKKDEIIQVASKLFFEKGYEETSIRDILEVVGGEVGMFYHHFKSKEALFQVVVDRFFSEYKKNFYRLTQECESQQEFITTLLEYYRRAMKQFHQISNVMHWTIQYAMTARTIEELKPFVVNLVSKWLTTKNRPVELVAGQLLYGISATLHSESFQSMTREEQLCAMTELCERILNER